MSRISVNGMHHFCRLYIWPKFINVGYVTEKVLQNRSICAGWGFNGEPGSKVPAKYLAHFAGFSKAKLISIRLPWDNSVVQLELQQENFASATNVGNCN